MEIGRGMGNGYPLYKFTPSPQVRVCKGGALRGGGRKNSEGVGEGCTSEGGSLPTNVLACNPARQLQRKQCELS